MLRCDNWQKDLDEHIHSTINQSIATDFRMFWPRKTSSIEYSFVYSEDKVQWNLSIKDTLNKEYLSNEDSVCSTNHIELCTNLPLN